MSNSVLIAQDVWDLTTQGRLVVTAILAVAVVVLYAVVRRVGRTLVNRMSLAGGERAERYQTMWSVLRKVILGVLIATAFLLGLTLWDISIAPFLTVGTVFGAAIGFGAQDLVKDVIGGFFILAEDQFHLGDTVTIAGTTGTVESIQLRVTVLRDLEGNVHYVPNGKIVVASNFTSSYAKPVIDIGIAYESDVDNAMSVLLDEMTLLAGDDEFGGWILEEPEVLGVHKLDDSAVVLRARFTTTADERWQVRREALRRIKKRFDAEGISIPFPQVTVNQKNHDL